MCKIQTHTHTYMKNLCSNNYKVKKIANIFIALQRFTKCFTKLFHLILTCKEDPIIIIMSILQMWKQRSRKVKWHAQGHIANKCLRLNLKLWPSHLQAQCSNHLATYLPLNSHT